jgi:mannosyltransferase OCH1-like enzyme
MIHQIWSEPLSTLRYPELVRIQNGWRSSGYRYHFYTPASARKFVDLHYPDRFLRAYDSIRSFDIQSNLFRLLVLFQEGGIYANGE